MSSQDAVRVLKVALKGPRVLRWIVDNEIYRLEPLRVDSFPRMSALPLKPPVTPVTFHKASLFGLFKPFS
jgi:hypothetical protein